MGKRLLAFTFPTAFFSTTLSLPAFRKTFNTFFFCDVFLFECQYLSLIGRVRNSSAFLPNGAYFRWLPSSCEAVPHSLRKLKGNRSYLYKNFFLHSGKNFLYKSPPHIVSLEFSWQYGVLWTQRCARALCL